MATIDGHAASPPGRFRPATEGAGTAPRPGAVTSQPAAETLRLYAGDWACFQAYCVASSARALPASPELVVAFLAAPGAGRAALARRLAAIDRQHRQRGYPPPGLDADVRTALRQARRVAPRHTRAAAPTAAALTRMAGACRGDLVGQRDRALLLLLASGLGRATVVALQAERLRLAEPGLTVTVRNRDDKTQTRHVPRAASPAACPVRVLEEWLCASATRYGPVFRKINRWGQLEHAAIGADAIRLILARRAAALPSGPRS